MHQLCDYDSMECSPLITYTAICIYWHSKGQPLSALKDQPFGIVMLSMGYFYSDVYSSNIYNACGWSLNVAVKQCSNATATSATAGTNCGVKGWIQPPPACCTKDITQANSATCPGKPNCDLQCSTCDYEASVCVSVCLCGCVAVWLCGCVAVSVSVCMSVRVLWNVVLLRF